MTPLQLWPALAEMGADEESPPCKKGRPPLGSERPREKVLLMLRGNKESHCGASAAWKTSEKTAVGTSGKPTSGSF